MYTAGAMVTLGSVPYERIGSPRNPTQTQTPRIRRIEGSSVAARDTATNFTAVADFQREFTGFHATTVQLVAADRLASELSPVGR